MEQTRYEHRTCSSNCILNSLPTNGIIRIQVSWPHCLSPDKWQVKPGGARRHILQHKFTHIKPPSAIPDKPPTPPGTGPVCIHYSPHWVHRQHAWRPLPLPGSSLNTINWVIAFVLGALAWLSKLPMILQAELLAALPVCGRCTTPRGCLHEAGSTSKYISLLAQPHTPY